MIKIESPQALDTFSANLVPVSAGMWEYKKPCSNGCFISIGSLERILHYLSKVTFSLYSPFIPDENISDNVERLASFRILAQGAGIPHYLIVGKWCGEDVENNTIDKGFILIKPDHMTKEEFYDFLRQSIRDYDQGAFVIKGPGENILNVDREGHIIRTYAGDLSIDLLAKASSYRLPMNSSFSFIGLEIPNPSRMSFQLFKGSKVEYYLPEDFFERKKVK